MFSGWGNWSEWTYTGVICGNYTETSERQCFTDIGARSVLSKMVLESLGADDIWIASTTTDNQPVPIAIAGEPSFEPCKDIKEQTSSPVDPEVQIDLDEGRSVGMPTIAETGVSRTRMIYTNTSCYSKIFFKLLLFSSFVRPSVRFLDCLRTWNTVNHTDHFYMFFS